MGSNKNRFKEYVQVSHFPHTNGINCAMPPITYIWRRAGCNVPFQAEYLEIIVGSFWRHCYLELLEFLSAWLRDAVRRPKDSDLQGITEAAVQEIRRDSNLCKRFRRPGITEAAVQEIPPARRAARAPSHLGAAPLWPNLGPDDSARSSLYVPSEEDMVQACRAATSEDWTQFNGLLKPKAVREALSKQGRRQVKNAAKAYATITPAELNAFYDGMAAGNNDDNRER